MPDRKSFSLFSQKFIIPNILIKLKKAFSKALFQVAKEIVRLTKTI